MVFNDTVPAGFFQSTAFVAQNTLWYNADMLILTTAGNAQ